MSHTHTLRFILDEIRMLKTHFDYISCQHIYTESNTLSDRLSKEGSQQAFDTWHVTMQSRHEHYQYYHHPFSEIE